MFLREFIRKCTIKQVVEEERRGQIYSSKFIISNQNEQFHISIIFISRKCLHQCRADENNIKI